MPVVKSSHRKNRASGGTHFLSRADGGASQDTERNRVGEGNSQTAGRREWDESGHQEKPSGQVLTHCRARGEKSQDTNGPGKRGKLTECRAQREGHVRIPDEAERLNGRSVMRAQNPDSGHKKQTEKQGRTNFVLRSNLLSAAGNSEHCTTTHPGRWKGLQACFYHRFRTLMPCFKCFIGPVMGLHSSHSDPLYISAYHRTAYFMLSSRLFLCIAKRMSATPLESVWAVISMRPLQCWPGLCISTGHKLA